MLKPCPSCQRLMPSQYEACPSCVLGSARAACCVTQPPRETPPSPA